MGEATPESYCLMHVGKTGDGSIKALISAHRRRHRSAPIRAFGHHFVLPILRERFPQHQVVFFVRDPVARYVSGFNSRLRQGRPKNDRPWTPQEEVAFRRFPTPNSLAEALSSTDAGCRAQAEQSMNDISHVQTPLRAFVGSFAFLQQCVAEGSIAMIGTMQYFAEDVARMQRIVGLDPDLSLPTDDLRTHRTPAGMETRLSEEGERNIRAWYRADYEIYGWCMQRREEWSAATVPDGGG